MNETSAAYLNLMNRLASSRAQRLRDVAQIAGNAQIASSQAWSAVPAQLAQIATNAYDTYQQDKRNTEMIRLRDIANQNEANRIEEMERTNRANEQIRADAATAKAKAEMATEKQKLGQQFVDRHIGQLLPAAQEALTTPGGYAKNRRFLDDGWRALAAANGQEYTPLPEVPDEGTLQNIAYAVTQLKGYQPKAEAKVVGNAMVRENPDGTFTPVYTAPAIEQRPVAVDTVDASGRNVRRFVVPKAGDEYPSQPPKTDAAPSEKPLTKVQVNAIKFRARRERDALKKTREDGGMTQEDYNAKMAEISASESEALGGKTVGGEVDAAPSSVGGVVNVVPTKEQPKANSPVGRTVTYKGKRYVVTGVDANGNAVLKPL